MSLSVRNKIFSWTSVSVCACLIFFGSVIPSHASSGLGVDNLDKILHFSIYAFFALIIAGTFRHKFHFGIGRILLFTLISAGVYGILIELVQHFIPYRDAELLDVYFNLIGIMTGVTVCRLIIW